MSGLLISQIADRGMSARLRPAVVTSVSPLQVDGVDADLPDASGVHLVAGDRVLVSSESGRVRVVRRITTRPMSGTVTAINGATAVVSTTAGTISLEWVGVQPALGARVGIVWDASGVYISGRLSGVTPTLPEIAPDPLGADLANDPAPPRNTIYVITFPALSVCTSKDGEWRTDLSAMAVQGAAAAESDKSGWAFYGPSAFAGSWVCLAMQLTLTRGEIGIGPDGPIVAHLRLHDGDTKGEALPMILPDAADLPGVYDGDGFRPGSTLTCDLPVQWGQKLIDTGGGLALVASGPTSYAAFIQPDPAHPDAWLITMTVQEV